MKYLKTFEGHTNDDNDDDNDLFTEEDTVINYNYAENPIINHFTILQSLIAERDRIAEKNPQLKEIYKKYKDVGIDGLTSTEQQKLDEKDMIENNGRNFKEEHKQRIYLTEILNKFVNIPQVFDKFIDALFEKSLFNSINNEYDLYFVRFIPPNQMGNEEWVIKVRPQKDRSIHNDDQQPLYISLDRADIDIIKSINNYISEIVNVPNIMKQINQ